ncbi:hypothetical protein GSI_02705 [Ganoderma sinense ZZ0214-1]|uniref:Thiamine pyrophosphate enzyme central domain-containing protein n=1 Tax=Ganoderma sinense ZZ0214-1 TaxID=1077348 RepID=A0A2G8SMW8_9APHY|nr:hypothetical protein GSI_02705 [Ganoderma sinense ZZ0214-1]
MARLLSRSSPVLTRWSRSAQPRVTRRSPASPQRLSCTSMSEPRVSGARSTMSIADTLRSSSSPAMRLIQSDRRLKGTKNEWPMWHQDVPDQPSIVRQYMRYTAQIQSGKNARQIVLRALQITTSHPKGPVYLWARRETTEEEVDESIFNEKVEFSKWPSVQGGGLPDSALNTIVDALLTAQFPLIITANAGRNPATVPLLAQLSTLLAIGIYTSCPMSMCIPWTHPHYIGTAFGGKNDLLPHADVIILLELDVGWVVAAGNAPQPGARVFVVDSDPLKMNWGWQHVDAELLCKADAETALTQLVGALDVPAAKAKVESDLVASRQARLKELRAAWVAAQEEAEAVTSLAEGSPTVPYVASTLRQAVAAQTASRGEKVLWVNESISNYPLVWTHLRRLRELARSRNGTIRCQRKP